MKGTQRVQRVLSKFGKTISELDKGVAEIEVEIEGNALTMDALQASNIQLADVGTTARNVAANLRKLMSVPEV